MAKGPVAMLLSGFGVNIDPAEIEKMYAEIKARIPLVFQFLVQVDARLQVIEAQQKLILEKLSQDDDVIRTTCACAGKCKQPLLAESNGNSVVPEPFASGS